MPTPFLPQEVIRRKRDGGELNDAEIDRFFNGLSSGEVSDYQVAAMLMAITLRGMTPRETARLTAVMRDSGTVFAWPYSTGIIADKHSTGGVGDKTSIVLLPLLASLGVKVPMIAGRGLGHTGGTLDKLEAIPGMRVGLSRAAAEQIVAEHGGVFMGQTEAVAPLDRRLYALRDVTATVESVPLITASILSKKLSEGLGALVMDVKFGTGAFMPTVAEARTLAASLRQVGEACGVTVRCLLTDMNSPLGEAAGNAVEIDECLRLLDDGGPSDTRELVLALATAALTSCPDLGFEATGARAAAEQALADGSARRRFEALVGAQGGDLDAFANRRQASEVLPVLAAQSGYIEHIDVRALGVAIQSLGGGRRQVSDAIDPAVGLIGMRRVGTPVTTDEPLCTVLASDSERATAAVAQIAAAYKISDAPPPFAPLVLETH